MEARHLFSRIFRKRRLSAHPKVRARYFGIRDGRICGAVYCPDHPSRRFQVELLADADLPDSSRVISTTLSNRTAWSGAGIPPGYGFDFEVPEEWRDGVPRKARFRVVETGRVFPHSDKWLTFSPGTKKTTSAILDQLLPSDSLPRLNLVLVTHELHRTGAPIIILNLLRQFASLPGVHCTVISAGEDGDLEGEFREYSDHFLKPLGDAAESRSTFLQEIANFLIASRSRVATVGLVNSLCSGGVAEAFRKAEVPCNWLIHEFPNAFSGAEIDRMIQIPHRIVFPCTTVRNAFATRLQQDKDSPQRLEEFLARSKVHPQGVVWGSTPSGSIRAVPPEDRGAIRESHGIREDTFLVLVVGTVDHRKGADWIVAFSRWFSSRHPGLSVQFAWIGKPTSPDFFRDVERDNQVGNNTEILRFLGERHDVDTFYQVADILLIPSRLDPFPNVALEALSFGLPFIGFDEGQGTTEILDRYDVGTKVSYQSFDQTEKALLRYLGDSKLGARQSALAREVAQKFTHESHFAAISETLRPLLPASLEKEGLLPGIQDPVPITPPPPRKDPQKRLACASPSSSVG